MDAKYRKSKPQTYRLKLVGQGQYRIKGPDITSQRIYLAGEANDFMNQQEKELVKLRSDAREQGFVTVEELIEMEKRATKAESEVKYINTVFYLTRKAL